MVRVKFENVSKHYSLINTGGIKTFLFNFFKQIKEYKNIKYKALENISFEVKDKEIVGIIGRNGAGKSTILGLIAGVLKANSGVVQVNGRIAPLLQLGAGFHHDLSGRDNIVLNGLLLGMSKDYMVQQEKTIIDFAELGEYIDQPIRMYSSGMLARLGFSIAVHIEPDILLIDEILAVGDAQFRKKSQSKIMEFKEKGVTIIFVSHDISTVRLFCDKVIWIENHTIRKQGLAEDVINEYVKNNK